VPPQPPAGPVDLVTSFILEIKLERSLVLGSQHLKSLAQSIPKCAFWSNGYVKKYQYSVKAPCHHLRVTHET
jgi:hypothetical protein